MWRAVAVALAAAAVAASSVDAPAAAGAAPAGDPYGGPPAPERAARGRWVYVAESDVDGASDAAWERAARERLEADLRDRQLVEHNATLHLGNGTGCHDEHHDGGHHAHVHKVLVFLFTALAAGALTLFLINHYMPSLPYTLALYIEGLILAIIIDRARTSLEPSLFYQTVRMWEHIGPHLLLYSFLPILLFGDSMSINTHLLAQKLIHCITLAVPGVMLGTTITGLVVWLLYPYDWSFCFCMMFGAIMSATDPVAVVALLKDLGASPAMTIVITGESLFNDGTAMVVFHLFFEIMSAYRKDGAVYDVTSPGDWWSILVFFVRMAVGGPLIGFAFGFMALWALMRCTRSHEHVDATLQSTITLVCAYLSFFVAEQCAKASGVLSCVCAGLVLAKYASPLLANRHAMHHIWEMFEHVGNTVIFMLAGLLTGEAYCNLQVGLGLLCMGFVSYVVAMVVRCIMLLILWPWIAALEKDQPVGKKLGWREGCVMAWGGLRGVVGLALAIIVYDEAKKPGIRMSEHEGKLILFHVGSVAFLTLLINGSTCASLLRVLGLTAINTTESILRRHVKFTVAARCRNHLVEEMDQITQNCGSEHWRAILPQEVLPYCSVLNLPGMPPAGFMARETVQNQHTPQLRQARARGGEGAARQADVRRGAQAPHRRLHRADRGHGQRQLRRRAVAQRLRPRDPGHVRLAGVLLQEGRRRAALTPRPPLARLDASTPQGTKPTFPNLPAARPSPLFMSPFWSSSSELRRSYRRGRSLRRRGSGSAPPRSASSKKRRTRAARHDVHARRLSGNVERAGAAARAGAAWSANGGAAGRGASWPFPRAPPRGRA